MSNFVKLSEYSEYHKDIVFGFIRFVQELLPRNKPYFNIPLLIKHDILMYCIGEYFAHSADLNVFKLENNDQTLSIDNSSNKVDTSTYSTCGQI